MHFRAIRVRGVIARGGQLGLAVALALVALVPGAPASAAVKGLLIGVADYAGLAVSLQGPPNDIALMYQLLVKRGAKVEDLVVLADGVAKGDAGAIVLAGDPTRANIVEALAHSADMAGQGDTFVLYFSGHGAQQPARAGDPAEPDGLDEIFLPADVGAADPATGMMANALTDDEIGQAIDRIRAKGALVWAIFDSCNSGSMTRQGQDSGNGLRMIPSARWEARPADPAGPIIATGRDGPEMGGYVGFFAARADQLTWEQPLPPEADIASRRVHGPLTFVLARALARRPVQSYRELSVAVFDGYDRLRVQGRRPVPVPSFEGDLDSLVLGAAANGDPGRPVERLDDARAVLHAGVIDGVAPGMVVRLKLAGAENPTPTVQAIVETTGYLRSGLTIAGPIPPDFPFQLMADLPEAPARRRFRVSAPVAVPGSDTGLALAPFKALTADTGGDRAFQFSAVAAGDPSADIVLLVEGMKLLLLPPAATWQPPPAAGIDRRHYKSVSLDGEAAAVAGSLAAAAIELGQGLNFLDIADRMVELSRARVTVGTYRLSAAEAPPATPADAYPCPQPPEDWLPPAAVALSDPDQPAYRHCDTLYLALRNDDAWPVDLSAFYVDTLGCVTPLFWTSRGFRLMPGKTRVLKVTVNTWSVKKGRPTTTGLERLVLLGQVRESPLDDAVVDTYIGLAPRCGSAIDGRMGDEIRRETSSGLKRMLAEAVGLGPNTRSGPIIPLEEKIFAHIARLRLLPPEGEE